MPPKITLVMNHDGCDGFLPSKMICAASAVSYSVGFPDDEYAIEVKEVIIEERFSCPKVIPVSRNDGKLMNDYDRHASWPLNLWQALLFGSMALKASTAPDR
jgi:hypothetical protein